MYRDEGMAFGQGFVGAMLAAKQLGLEQQKMAQQERYQASLMDLNDAQAEYYRKGGRTSTTKTTMFSVPQLDDIAATVVGIVGPKIKKTSTTGIGSGSHGRYNPFVANFDYVLDQQDEEQGFMEMATMLGGEGLSPEQIDQLRTIYDSTLQRGEQEGFIMGNDTVRFKRNKSPVAFDGNKTPPKVIIGADPNSPVPGEQREINGQTMRWEPD
jgi:hypothetical protein